jgi:hypothetical protein
MIADAIDSMRNLHQGQTCYIVGKGPSLQFLDSSHFPDPGCVIAINSAIAHVQKLGLSQTIYSMQKDGNWEDMVEPRDDVILILQDCASSDWFPNHPMRLILDLEKDLGMQVTEMSIRVCIALGGIAGCGRFSVLCCDSLLLDEYRTWDARSQTLSEDANSAYGYARPLVLEDLHSVSHQIIIPENTHREHHG